MIRVFCAGIQGLPDPRESVFFAERLSFERREGALGAVSVEERRRRLGAGLLLDRILVEYGVSPQEIRIGAHGKPIAKDLFFNLSHSGEMVALAVSKEGRIGCDLEKIRSVPEKVLRKFSFEERDLLECRASEEREFIFFRLWTRRESYLKMTGEGLSGLSRIKISGEELYYDEEKAECNFAEYKVGKYLLTVCAETGEFPAAAETVTLV